jgi:hypothetical protein
MVIDDLAACALQSTVVGTTATADYAVPLHRLATTAAKVGFPCIAVQAIDRGFPWVAPLTKNSSLFHTLPDIAPFWPRERFCDEHETRYGWRRVHVYKMRMWLTVLQSGYDLFSVDADWMFIRNPVARLRAAHELRPSFADPRNLSDPYRFVRTAVGTEPADFVALVHDGMTRRQINIGLVYVRAGDRTIALARTLLNRSYAAQDQPLVNEELNWGHVNVSCCISEVRWASLQRNPGLPCQEQRDAFDKTTADTGASGCTSLRQRFRYTSRAWAAKDQPTKVDCELECARLQ